MSQVIRIPDSLFERLESHAEGFDTPANVIERILSAFEKQNLKPNQPTEEQIKEASNLDIEFSDLSEEQFKQLLLEKKACYVTRYFTDGKVDTKRWNASKFKSDSSVKGNLRSGLLRGWRKSGIFKAKLTFSDPNTDE